MSNWGDYSIAVNDNTLTVTGSVGQFPSDTIPSIDDKANIQKVKFKGPIVFNTKTGTNGAFSGFFNGFTSLKYIEGLENVDTTNVNDLSKLFMGCSSLEYINVSSLNLSNVNNISSMFEGCTKLAQIDGLDKWDTSKITKIDNLFKNCASIKTLDLSKLDVSKLKSASAIIEGCSKLYKIITPSAEDNTTPLPDVFISGCIKSGEKWGKETNLDTNKCNEFALTGDGQMMYSTTYYKDRSKVWGYLDNGCNYELSDDGTILYISDGIGKTTSNGATPAVYTSPFTEVTDKTTVTKVIIEGTINFPASTELNKLFDGFTNLAEVEGLPNIKTTNVTSVTDMFNGCTGLTEANLTGFTVAEGIFNSCDNLLTFTAPTLSASVALGITGEWSKASEEANWTDVASATTKITLESEAVYYKKFVNTLVSDNSKIENYVLHTDGTLVIPNQTTWYEIDSSVWSDQKENITSIRILSQTNKPTKLVSMFEGLDKLANIYGLENLITTNATDISNMFKDCIALTKLDLSKVTFGNSTVMSNFINGCTGLTEIIMPKVIPSNLTTELSANTDNWMTTVDTQFNRFSAISVIPNMRYFSSNYATKWGDCVYFTSTTHTNNVTECTLHILGGKGSTTSDGQSSPTFTSPFDSIKTTVTKVIIENPITFDTTGATLNKLFNGFTNLTKIIGLDKLDTSNVTDMTSMFDGCTALTSVDISKFDTSKVTAFNLMFNGCAALTQLDFSSFSTTLSTEPTAENIIQGCSGLSRVVTSKITNINTAIKGVIIGNSLSWKPETSCNSTFSASIATLDNSVGYVKYIENDKWGDDTSNCCIRWIEDTTLYISNGIGKSTKEETIENGVTTITYTPPFDSMKHSVTKVVFLGPVNFGDGTSLRYLFRGFSRLTEIININYLDISHTDDLFNMFDGCKNLKNIDMTIFNSAHAIALMNIHYHNKDLTAKSINLFNTYNVTNMSSMFNSCNALTDIDLSKITLGPGITTVENMFNGCSNLTDVDLTNFNVKTDATIVTTNMFNNCTKLSHIRTPKIVSTELNTALTSALGSTDKWKNDNKADTSFTVSPTSLLPSSNYVKQTENDKWGETDKECIYWKTDDTLYISGGIGSTITDKNSPFSKYNTVTKIVITGPIAFGASTSIQYLFKGFSHLTEIVGLDKLDISNVTNTSHMFDGCKKLRYLDISMLNLSNIINTSHMFSGCEVLKNIDVTKLDLSNVTDMTSMFEGCQLLESIDLTSVTLGSVNITLDSMFKNCSSLKTIDFSVFDNVTSVTSSTDIINGCNNLMRVITSSQTIEGLALTGNWKDNKASSNTFDTVTTINASTDYIKEDTTHYWGDKTTNQTKLCVYWVEGTILYISSGIAATTKKETTDAGGVKSTTYVSPFDSVKHLVTKIVFTGPVTFDGEATLQNLFVNFTQLTEVVGLDKINDEYHPTDAPTTTAHYINNITDMFGNCCLLKHLDLSMFVTNNFNMTDCVNLESVVSPTATTKPTSSLLSSWYPIGQSDNTTYVSKAVYLPSIDASGKQWGTCYYTYDSNDKILTLYGGIGVTTEKAASEGGDPTYESPFDASIKTGIKSIVIVEPITFNETVSLQSFCDGCEALEHIEGLEYIDFTKVNDISKMFYECKALKSIDFSKCNFSKINAFTNIVKTTSTSSLVRIITPKIIPSDLSTELQTLAGTVEWKTNDNTSSYQANVTFNPSTDYIKKDTTNVWGDTTGTTYCIYWIEGKTLYISGGVGKTTSDGQNSPTYASPFTTITDKTTVTKVVFTGSVSLSASGSLESFFEGFSNLTEVVGLDNIDIANVESYNKFFKGCGFKQFDLNNFNYTFSTTFNDIFSGCNSLNRIITPKIYTDNLNTGLMSFLANSSWKDNTDSANQFKTYSSSDTFSPLTDYVIVSNVYWGDTTDTAKCVLWDDNKTLYISGGQCKANGTTTTPLHSTPQNFTKIVITGPIKFGSTGALKAVFSGFTNVTEIVGLEKLDISKANDITAMFKDCNKLRTLDLSQFNTGNVTSFEEMFKDCKCLSKVYGMSFSTSNVTNMSSMFDGCLSLQSVNTKTFDTSKVTNMSNMFNGCVSLRYLDLGTFNCTLADSSYSNIIQDANSIIELTTPITLGTSADGSFKTEVTTLFGLDRWKYLDKAFGTITTLSPLTTYTRELETKWGSTTNKEVIYSIETIGDDIILHLSSGIGKSTANNSYPFELISKEITKIVVTGPITFDSGSSLAQLFNDFHNLNEFIGLEYIDVTNVTNLSNVLSETSLGYIDLSKWNTTNVTIFTSLCADNPKLRGINLNNLRTHKVTTMFSTFSNCPLLESVDLSSFNPNSLTNIDLMFNNCSQLETIDLTNITNSKITTLLGSDNAISAIALCDKLHMVKTGSELSTDIVNDLKTTFATDWKLANDSNTIQTFNTLSTIQPNSYYVKKDVNTWGDTTQTNYCTWFTSQDNRTLYISNGTAKDTPIFSFDVSDITKIVILGKIDFTEGSKLDSLFKNFSNLTVIEGLNQINTVNVTSMQNMFNGCTLLQTLDLSGFSFSGMANSSSESSGGQASEQSLNNGKLVTREGEDDSGSGETPIVLTGLTDFITGCDGLTRVILPSSLQDKNNKAISLTFLTDVMYKKASGATADPKWSNSVGTNVIKDEPTDGSSDVQLAANMDCFKETYTPRWYGLPVYIKDNVLYICGGTTIESSKVFTFSDNSDDFTSINILHPVTLTDDSSDNNGYVFNGLTNLTSINGWNNYKVDGLKKYPNAFNGCTNLTSIDMSTWDFTALVGTVASGATTDVFTNGLSGCYSLSDFTTPKSVNSTVDSTFKTDLFSSIKCSIHKDGTNTKIDSDDGLTAATKYLYVTSKITNANRRGRWYYSEYNKTLYVIGGESNSCTKTTTNGTTTYTSVFTTTADTENTVKPTNYSKTNVVTVKFLSNLSFLKTSDSELASICGLFEGFTSLVNIVGLNKIDISNVSDLDAMFKDCGQLEAINMNSWSVEKVSTMTDFVSNCTSLQYIVTPSAISDTTVSGKIATAIKPTSDILYSHLLDKLDTTIKVNTLYSKNYAVSLNGLIYTPTTTANKFECVWNYENALKTTRFNKLVETTTLDNTSSVTSTVSTFVIECPISTKIFANDSLVLKSVGTITGFINLVDTVKSDGTTENPISFKDYSNIEVIDFTGCSVKLSSVDNMFNGCSELEYVNFGKLDLSGITGTVTDAFTSCTGLVRLVTPSSVPTDLFSGLTASEWFSVNDTSAAISSFAANETYVKPLTDKTNQWNSVVYSNYNNVLRLSSGIGKTTSDGQSSPTYASPFTTIKTQVSKIIIEGKITLTADDSLQNLFNGFTALTEIEGLDNLECINVVDMKQMFKGCSSLCYINLYGLNTVNVTDVTDMFNGCPLVYLDLTTFNSSSLSNSSNVNMFDSSLKLIHTPKLPMSKEFEAHLTTTLASFKNPSGSTSNTITKDTWYNNYGDSNTNKSITCNNGKTYIQYKDTELAASTSDTTLAEYPWKTDNDILVKTMDLRCDITFADTIRKLSNMFSGYYNLERLMLHDININAIVDISSMFENCTNLKHVNLAHLNNSTASSPLLETIDNMFNNCPNIEVIDFTNINMSGVTKGSNTAIKVYSDDPKYKIIYPPFNPSDDVKAALVSTNHKFGTDALSENNITHNTPYINTTALSDGSKWDSGDTDNNCLTVDVDGLITLVTGVEKGYSTAITKPTWNDKYKDILHSIDLSHVSITNAVTKCDNLFSDCVQLFDIKELKRILCYPTTVSGQTQYNCKLTSMKEMFKNCKTLDGIDFSNINVDDGTILGVMDNMFYNCNLIKTLDLSIFTINGSTTIGNNWLDCSLTTATSGRQKIKQLESITIPTFATGVTLTDLGTFKDYFKDVFGNWYNQDGYGDSVSTDETSIVSGATYKGEPGTWGTYRVTYTENKTKITITGDTDASGTGHGGYSKFDTTANTSNIIWNNSKDTVETIEFTDYIKFITEASKENNGYAGGLFANFVKLTKVEFGTDFNFTNIKNIDGMFYGCTALTTIDFSNVTFGPDISEDCTNMFKNCTALTEITFPKDYKVDTAKNITNVSAKVSTELEKLVCPTGGTNWYNKETNIQLLSSSELKNNGQYSKTESLWNECNWNVQNGKLTITGETDSTKVAKKASSYSSTEPHYPWEGSKTKITSVVINGKITLEANSSLQEWFNGYSNLTSITGLNNVDVSNVTNLNKAFYGTKIARLIINKWDTSNVTNATDMLPIDAITKALTQQSLKSRFKILKPSFLELSLVTRESPTTSMKIVYIPKTLSEAEQTTFKSFFVTHGFYDSDNNLVTNDSVIKTVSYYYASDVNKWDDSSNVRYDINEDNTVLTLISKGSITKTFPTDVTKSSLKSIIPKAQITLPNDCSSMFDGCTSLENFNFAKWDMSEVTNMSNMFDGCTALKVIDFKGADLTNVTTSTGMFNGCTAIELVYTPKVFGFTKSEFNTLFTDASKKFKDYNETDVTNAKENHWYHDETLSNTNKTWTVDNQKTYIEYLRKIDVTDKSITTDTTLEGMMIREVYTVVNTVKDLSSMFSTYTQLTEVDITGLRTWYTTNVSNMFSGCINLLEVDLSNFTTDDVIDFSGMFNGCIALKTIKFNKY